MTAFLQAALYSEILILFPMSSFDIPNSFSTPNSTGSPCVSQPAFLFTLYPFKVLYLQKASLIVLAIT